MVPARMRQGTVPASFVQLGRPGRPQTLFSMFPASHKRTALFPVRSPKKQLWKVIATSYIPTFFAFLYTIWHLRRLRRRGSSIVLLYGACGAVQCPFFSYVAPAAPQVSVDFPALSPKLCRGVFCPTPFWNHFSRSVFFRLPIFHGSAQRFFSDSFSSFLPFFLGLLTV